MVVEPFWQQDPKCFDRLLYNETKESYEKQISFPEINSTGMEIILEYIYTGLIKKESLTEDSIVEAFYAADYFQLPDFEKFITNTIKITNYTENYSPELLSKVADTMPLSDNNNLLNLLIEKVAAIPLNTIEFGQLSISALRYLLSSTHEKEIPFATSEYEVFRYGAILAAKKVSNDAYKTLMGQLPTLKQLENSIKVENKVINNHQEIAKELEPLIKFIEFRRIKGQILAAVIEPLQIVPSEIIVNVYRHVAMTNNPDLNAVRGLPIYNSNEYELAWDESACGSKLLIEGNGQVVRAPADCPLHQNVRTKMILEDKGIIEWDVIIEKVCGCAWVGVCAPENLDYERFAGYQPTGWVLGSGGACFNSSRN